MVSNCLKVKKRRQFPMHRSNSCTMRRIRMKHFRIFDSFVAIRIIQKKSKKTAKSPLFDSFKNLGSAKIASFKLSNYPEIFDGMYYAPFIVLHCVYMWGCILKSEQKSKRRRRAVLYCAPPRDFGVHRISLVTYQRSVWHNFFIRHVENFCF